MTDDIVTHVTWITDFGHENPTRFEQEQLRRMHFCKRTGEPRHGSKDWHLYRYMLAAATTRAHFKFVTETD